MSDRFVNKAKVKIISFTENALDLLLYTKERRLGKNTTLRGIDEWSYEKKMDQISYMLNTIKSSFEFVDYIFEIRNVSRAFTHQLVRTRTASFQQESQRAVDVRSHEYLITSKSPIYKLSIERALIDYKDMIDGGEDVQNARGVLPTAIYTSIFVKANLRTLSQIAELRLCKRTQGEYQEVFKKIVKEVIYIHSWADPLLQAYCIKNCICAFPNYKACPVQKFCFNPEERREKIKAIWKKSNHVANPVVNEEGKTM